MSKTAPLARRGFTIIEVLAALLIVVILAAVLVPALLSSSDSVKTSATRALLRQLSAEIEAFERIEGRYPPSRFPASLDPRPSEVNMGCEMLVLSLLPADGSYAPTVTFEEHLGNTDGDRTKVPLTRFSNPEVFEFVDSWGNPIAYLERRDYERGGLYRAVDFDGVASDERVTAATSEVTGDPYRSASFQLLSAGKDGVFDTEDDIGNFKGRN